MDREDQRVVKVNQVPRDHQVRGAGTGRWAPVEKPDHRALERKETKDLKARKGVQVLLVLWGRKVPWESRVPQEAPALQVQRVSRVKQEHQEKKVTEEHQG